MNESATILTSASAQAEDARQAGAESLNGNGFYRFERLQPFDIVCVTIRSGRWRTCWSRQTSASSRAAFTLAAIRTRSRTSAVGSTATQ